MKALESIEERHSPLFIFICLFIIATFVLGGANENDWLANVILLYLATPLVLISLYRLMTSGKLAGELAFILCGLSLALAVPLLQLAPLPENIWRELPFHDLAARALSAAGVNHPSGPLSLAPNLTWVSLLSSLPPLAIFLTVLLLNRNERRSVILVVLVCGVINAIFGLVQSAQNSETGFYFYPGMNAGDATGFFKNRNHFAAQMYALLPFAAAMVVNSLNLSARSSRRGKIVSDYLSLFLGLACVFVLIVTCVFAKSRAGVVILMVALVWILFLPDWKNIKFRGKETGKKIYLKALGLFLGVSVLFALEYAFYRVINRFEEDSLFGARQEVARNTLETAIKASPYGTGLGTFQKIYAAVEPVENVLPHKFVNRAHNDYLELFLETGAAGPLIVIVFLFWYGAHVWNVWRHRSANNLGDYLTRASCIAIGLLLLHSFVDYPLRTHVLMGLFALSCALLAGAQTDDTVITTDPRESRFTVEQGRIHSERRRRRTS